MSKLSCSPFPGSAPPSAECYVARHISWRGVLRNVDVSNDRRTAESVLDIEADEMPDAIVDLVKSKRLSIVMRSLDRLIQNPVDRELGRRAIRHLGFPDD